MKKIITVLVISLSFTGTNSQQITKTAIPVAVKSSFAKMFPGVNEAKWDKEKNLYKASYTHGQHKGSVLFDSTGKWLEREISIAIQGLPQKALAYMKGHFKGQTLKEASKITKANGEILYEAEIKDKKIFFSCEGIFLRMDRV